MREHSVHMECSQLPGEGTNNSVSYSQHQLRRSIEGFNIIGSVSFSISVFVSQIAVKSLTYDTTTDAGSIAYDCGGWCKSSHKVLIKVSDNFFPFFEVDRSLLLYY